MPFPWPVFILNFFYFRIMFYKQLNISVHKKVNSVHLGGNLIVGKIFDVEKYQKDRKVHL